MELNRRLLWCGVLLGCAGCPADESDGTPDTDASVDTDDVETSGAPSGGPASTSSSTSGSTTSSADASEGTDGTSDSGPTTGTTGGPPSEPGVHNTDLDDLPGGEPTACEWNWTLRTLHYHPGAVVPRRMYHASCDAGPNAKMLTSITLGPDAEHPMPDPTSGALILSEIDDATGTLDVVDSRLFPECRSMHGVAMSGDCGTIGVLCRVPIGNDGFDADVLATHPDADWMTNPYVCGDDKMNDEMWLYEWADGDIQAEPERFIVHKSIGSWEYGNDYLRLGNDESTWGIGMKTTVGGAEGAGTCHEADAFLVMDRESDTFTTRGWSWACGTGHTLVNRNAYNPATGKYAALCSTDYNDAGTGGLGAYVFRMEDGDAQEFHYLNLDGIQTKGAASALVPVDDGGFLGAVVGVPGEANPGGVPEQPPTEIGLVRWSAQGEQQGDIRWVIRDPDGYVSYSTLAPLGNGRFFLGWGVMRRNDEGDLGDASLRVPWEFWAVEVDAEGEMLGEPFEVEGAGWGEMDEPVPLGQGRVGWSYIPDPTLADDASSPSCNQDRLRLSVYTSPL